MRPDELRPAILRCYRETDPPGTFSLVTFTVVIGFLLGLVLGFAVAMYAIGGHL